MALYIPAGRRRRRAVLIGLGALVVGLAVGLLIGRLTATSATQQIHSIQNDARETAAGLRVISLHDEAGVGNSGDGGTALVLERTRTELTDELDRAEWVTSDARDALLIQLQDLTAQEDKSSPTFGQAVDDLATAIDQTFGTTG